MGGRGGRPLPSLLPSIDSTSNEPRQQPNDRDDGINPASSFSRYSSVPTNTVAIENGGISISSNTTTNATAHLDSTRRLASSFTRESGHDNPDDEEDSSSTSSARYIVQQSQQQYHHPTTSWWCCNGTNRTTAMILIPLGVVLFVALVIRSGGGVDSKWNPYNSNQQGTAAATTIKPFGTGSSCGSPTSSSSETTSSSSPSRTIHYNASATQMAWNPWDLQLSEAQDAASLLQPQWPSAFANDAENDDTSTSPPPSLGYIMQPDIVNGTVVFVSEGELYWTRLVDNSNTNNSRTTATSTLAVKLTSCRPGRVQTPKINPTYPYLIAYVANYQAVNEVYVLDVRKRRSRQVAAAQRLTYTDSLYGVTAIVGWKNDGATLVYAALHTAVGLRDVRLYEIALVQGTAGKNDTTTTSGSATTSSSSGTSSNSNRTASSTSPLVVLETRPVPLAQAVDGVWATSSSNSGGGGGNSDNCLYFVRFQQYSHTARYVGGTAEQLWAYCDGRSTAVPLTTDYAGTSKAPQIWSSSRTGSSNGRRQYLLFMSDRSRVKNNNGTVGAFWEPATMNLWAVALPTESDLYTSSATTNARPILSSAAFVQLTNVACQFSGWTLREYAVDVHTGRVVLRIGADLHWLTAETIEAALSSSATTTPTSPRSIAKPHPFSVQIQSDFVEQHERIIEIEMNQHLTDADVFETDFGMTGFLMTVRGQLWVLPVTADASNSFPFQGSGQNLPERRYRVIPGAMTGGMIRVLQALVVPKASVELSEAPNDVVLALVLATDPKSPTGELGFYLIQVQPSFIHGFSDMGRLPAPFVGGHVNGGSSLDGGLGTIKKGSVVLSPCGRRFAWADMDDRICVMTLPIRSLHSQNETTAAPSFQCLSKTNDMGEPMAGTLSDLSFSPGGRYLAVNHKARNQMRVISLVDCGELEDESGEILDVQIGASVQITSNRFNSYGMLWGKSRFDVLLHATLATVAKSMGLPKPNDSATTMFFLSDRDIVNDVSSPWGSRAPMPHFRTRQAQVFALPLFPTLHSDEEKTVLMGRYAGGGGMETFARKLASYEKTAVLTMSASAQVEDGDDRRRSLHEAVLSEISSRVSGRKLAPYERALIARRTTTASATKSSGFPKDDMIDFIADGPALMERAYRVAHIPAAEYLKILSQTDDGSLSLIQSASEGNSNLVFFASEPYPDDGVSPIPIPDIGRYGLCTSRDYIFAVTPKGKFTRVVSNTATGLASFARDTDWNQQKVDTAGLAISVWPSLEYRQIFADAWRLLRDYFYDPKMHSVDWISVFSRYEPLVQRCAKREELDDVLSQMISELSALHSYVYIGESTKPTESLYTQATLAAGFKRVPAWKGFMITEIPVPDPDFNTIGGLPIYSPLSDQALRLSGQRGLSVGDVIVAVNGESVMHAPDINMLLRGSLGRSVRLEVLRLASGNRGSSELQAEPEPLITVPTHPQLAYTLRVNAWEWRTRQKAKELALRAGFTIGYAHLQSMHSSDEDAFARAFYPDYDVDALIIDVRHNDGGFIDSWLLDTLQRKAWMFWSGRGGNRTGGMDWDEQYAFRGKVVVLHDEFTASNAEGFCRGISELGLGRLIGKRTWGGGIWGSSTNTLVDGGIATAPQWGTFNEKFGWGGGVEMTGVSPDIEVDNDPRGTFDGHDSQLERAILELKQWLKDDPIPAFRVPGERPNKSLAADSCQV